MKPNLMIWTGRILTGIFAIFMLVASIMPKLIGADVATNSLRELGWPDGYVLMIGLIELACLVLYLIPRTSILGAILTMGLLGGAMATQIRVENPIFSHVFFSLYLGLFMWGGLWLRNAALRRLFPLYAPEENRGATV
ncbi:DoxX family protein [Ahrensia marina]|uniref:Polyhydroxyalkanoate depolymerase n=1 Tax=Ahrensia marina TaxID=1514904 RepID=A0A0M9GKG8_9HYPH|nr:DoxX family protein [Ahrensia marina]KPA99869.1 polyhydroxyalkanoate depolymerase [Ahrensia marina]